MEEQRVTAMRRRTQGWWQGMLLLAALPWLTPARCLAVQTTMVKDTVSRADGSPAQGTVLVSWPSFTAADGTTVAAGTTTVTIAPDGTLTLALAPNAGADPQGSYYTAVYHLTDGTVQKEYWVVPQSGTATVSQIRAKVVPAAVAQQTVSRQYVDTSISAAQANFLPLKGGALTGTLALAGDPTSGLQAATKQYVDTHAGVVTQATVIGAFHTDTGATTTILSTSFHEGAAGTSLAGSRPATYTGADVWHFGDAGTQWNFQSGGGVLAPAASTGATGGAYIDLGVADYTANVSVANAGGSYMMVMLRYTDANNMVFVNLNGGTGNANVTVYNYVNGGLTQLGAGALQLTTLRFLLSGANLTVSDDADGTPIHATIPAGANLTATKFGFTLESGANASINSVTVTVATTLTVACQGVMQGDGKCGPVAANEGVAVDGVGHVNPLPERGTTTDLMGHSAVAWAEDYTAGIYDARNPKYAGGIFGPTPSDALQAVEDQINCDMAMGLTAQGSVTLPPGVFSIGNITLAPGSYLGGSADGNASKTTLNHNLSTGNMLYVWTSRTTTCSDGRPHTNGANHAKIEHLNLHGCGEFGCSNVPGDPTNYGGAGGPGDTGLDMETFQGDVEWISADHFGGTAVRVGGVDSQGHHIYTMLNNEAYLFGIFANPDGTYSLDGNPYDPAKDGYHGDVELAGVDGQYDYIETYGTLHAPGPEYGHVAGILTGGGDSSFSHLWPQLNEIGIMQPYGYGANDRFFDVRVDFSMGEGILLDDASMLFIGGIVDGSCNSSNVPSLLGGACLQLDSRGLGATFIGLQFAQNAGFGPTYETADIGASYGAKFIGTTGTFAKNAAYPYATSISWTWDHNPQYVTGPVPDVSAYDSLVPVDTAPITYTNVINAFPSQELWIQGGNAMVTLQSTATGGRFEMCSNQDTNLGSVRGWLHFKAETFEIYGEPVTMGEVCPTPSTTADYAVPASAGAACPKGVKAFGAAPTGQTGAGWYVCDPANTWTYYPQAAGTF